MSANCVEPLSFRNVDPPVRPSTTGSAGVRGDVAKPGLGDHGTPVTFGRTTGFFHAGSGNRAVLMLGPIGYEDLCARASWRLLAQRLSAAGISCLRFDYPGTGDALDPRDAPEGLEDWREDARRAADLLRAASGAGRIALLGQGLGAALAVAWSADLGPVEACVLMAPVASGRRYLRELGGWTGVMMDRIGLDRDPADAAGCAVAGFAIAPARAAAIRALDIAALDTSPAPTALVIARPEHPGDQAVADRLARLGTHVTRGVFSGYDELMSDPTAAVVPDATHAVVVEWLAARGVPAHATRGASALDLAAPQLHGEGFVERPVRFGLGARLVGVLCEPAAGLSRVAWDNPRNSASPSRRDEQAGVGEPTPACLGRRAAVFVNAGREHRIGWGRATVGQARALAVRGIASLRFDTSGMGDSPPAEDHPGETLYSQAQIDDVRAAIDMVEAAGFAEVALIGRCSGAYAAFNTAVQDSRVGHVVVVNAPRLVWDPDENIAEALRYGHRSLGDFGAMLKSRDGLNRFLTGRLRMRAAGFHLAHRFAKAASLAIAPLMGRLTKQGRLLREVRRRLAVLTARGVRVAFVFADRDFGLADFERCFGRFGRRLAWSPGVSVRLVADADHNFTHAGAQSRLLDVLLAALGP